VNPDDSRTPENDRSVHGKPHRRAPLKRTPLRPSTKRIPRYAELKRSQKPIPKRRKDPSKRAWAKHRCKPFTDWLKTQACCLTGKHTGDWFSWLPRQGFQKVYHPFLVIVDPAHVIKRSRGSDDLYNCLPLARHLHDEQEGRNAAFEAKYQVDLTELARQYTERWLATPEGIAWTAEHPTEGE
jgi:hypothetical protein